MVSFNGKLWIIGGQAPDKEGDGNVWSSANGSDWDEVTREAPWARRHGHSVLVHNSELWLLGGYSFRDVWHSPNGSSWTSATLDAPWGGDCAAAVAYDGKIWALTTDYAKNALWRAFFVVFHFVDRICVPLHADTGFVHGPREQTVQDFPIAIGRL